jgi:hypothetical protein
LAMAILGTSRMWVCTHHAMFISILIKVAGRLWSQTGQHKS